MTHPEDKYATLQLVEYWKEYKEDLELHTLVARPTLDGFMDWLEKKVGSNE